MDEIKEITDHTRSSLLRYIPIEKLKRGRYQPRNSFADEGIDSLADTIKKFGVLEPLLVRPLAIHGTFEIIAGERRWRAAQKAGLESVPCLVSLYTDEKASHIALIENIGRENLNPIEEAEALNKIIMEFDYTHEEIAKNLGKKRTQITNLLRLLKLDDRVQEFLILGQLQEGHGKNLAGIEKAYQYKLALECIEKQWSVHALGQQIKALEKFKTKKPQMRTGKNSNIKQLEREVADCFGHPVEVDWTEGKGNGFIRIPFKNLSHLDSILHRMGYRKKDFE